MRRNKLTEQCPFDDESYLQRVVFAQSDGFIAIYNISPITPGHSLIIPRRHVESLYHLTESECVDFVTFARRVTKLLLRVFSSDAFDWTIQEGEPAGQSITHLHLHVIPRIEGDLESPGAWYPKLELQRQLRLERGEIDSADRPHIRSEDATVIVARLRQAATKAHLFSKFR